MGTMLSTPPPHKAWALHLKGCSGDAGGCGYHSGGMWGPRGDMDTSGPVGMEGSPTPGPHRGKPLLEHLRRAPGGRSSAGSRVCLRAEFVLKRFIIFLTGRFPVSVLVNNCSQLNVRKICNAGVGGAEENFSRARAQRGIAASLSTVTSQGHGMGMLGDKICSRWGKCKSPPP